MSSEVIFLGEISHAVDLKAEITSRRQILTANQWKSLKSLEKSIPRSQVVRIIGGEDELKKHSRTSPEVQFKEFSLTKQKGDIE